MSEYNSRWWDWAWCKLCGRLLCNWLLTTWHCHMDSGIDWQQTARLLKFHALCASSIHAKTRREKKEKKRLFFRNNHYHLCINVVWLHLHTIHIFCNGAENYIAGSDLRALQTAQAGRSNCTYELYTQAQCYALYISPCDTAYILCIDWHFAYIIYAIQVQSINNLNPRDKLRCLVPSVQLSSQSHLLYHDCLHFRSVSAV